MSVIEKIIVNYEVYMLKFTILIIAIILTILSIIAYLNKKDRLYVIFTALFALFCFLISFFYDDIKKIIDNHNNKGESVLGEISNDFVISDIAAFAKGYYYIEEYEKNKIIRDNNPENSNSEIIATDVAFSSKFITNGEELYFIKELSEIKYIYTINLKNKREKLILDPEKYKLDELDLRYYYNGNLYFLAIDNFKNTRNLYVLNVETEVVEELITNVSLEIFFTDYKIYFSKYSKENSTSREYYDLYCINYDGTDIQFVIENYEFALLRNNNLYLIKEDQFIKIDSLSVCTVICNLEKFCGVSDNYVFYIDIDNKILYMQGLDGSSPIKLWEFKTYARIPYIAPKGDTIYIVDDLQIYKIFCSSQESGLVGELEESAFVHSLVGDYLFYDVMEDSGFRTGYIKVNH